MIVRDKLPLKRIWPQAWRRLLVLLIFDCTVAVIYSVFHHKWISLNGLPVAPLASALTIFLAFRTNAAYGRWWEARQLWGKLVNYSRALTRQYLTMLDDETEERDRPPLRNELVKHQIAFAHALRCHLRKQASLPELKTLLGEEIADELSVYKNIPAAINLRTGKLLRQARSEGMLDSFRWTAIDDNLTEMSNIQGACERIKNTPLPRQFEYLPRILVDVFCWLLPLGIVDDLGLVTPIASTLISFTFIAADLMSREISNPFDNTIHDTPMTALSRTIELNLREQMTETDKERGWHEPSRQRVRLDVTPVDGFVF
ncbi:MAG: bestrophin family ion channel [Edaphobacter sp.]|uniref:bestrophin family protein n=1 Tax=Edaphobacter sp. TaxID=1934404 RepID=UPI002396310F|nr:bestrophin family ion channel [Edaphobacter sp.]MDE1176541.1 bestrophin family ion channel [Edaphobacter sp.]